MGQACTMSDIISQKPAGNGAVVHWAEAQQAQAPTSEIRVSLSFTPPSCVTTRRTSEGSTGTKRGSTALCEMMW